MMVTNENYEKPAHVPDDFFVPGNIWEAMGDRPHDRLQQIAKGREMIFLQTHQIPGHSPQGTWLAGSARVARQILLDSATFSSNNVTGFARLLGNDLIYFPVDVDPPAHTKYRALIAKHFMPASVSALREVVRSRIDTLLDGIIAKGGCEFVAEFAKVLPATIFLDLVGLPRERADDFLKWADVSLCAPTPQERITAMVCIRDYLASEIECRQKDPRNDILSALANGEIDGRRLEFREALGGAMILYIAGLDTVAGQLGWIFRHLAEDTELQMSLRRDPSRLAKVHPVLLKRVVQSARHQRCGNWWRDGTEGRFCHLFNDYVRAGFDRVQRCRPTRRISTTAAPHGIWIWNPQLYRSPPCTTRN